MMLKKKEKDRKDREKKDREDNCTEINEEEIIERDDDEQRDDRSTICEGDNEERDDIGLDEHTIDSGSAVEAPSLVSYIGTIAGSSIDTNSIGLNNTDPLSKDSQDAYSHDSQYLKVESDSTTGLSYIGTAVMQDTPLKNLTALNNEDRIIEVPAFDVSCEEKKKSKAESMDLIQVETTPTDDETLSLEVTGSQSFGSAGLTPKTSNSDGNEGGVQTTLSQDSVDEKDDTLSPLPPHGSTFGRLCYSPARSYAASLAVSSASTSVSDVFGMLRTSLNPALVDSTSSTDDDVVVQSSSSEENDNMFDADVKMIAQDVSLLTSNRPKKKRSKSMTSMHHVDRCGLTLGNALMATNIFTPPRSTKTNTLSSPAPSSLGAAYSKRSDNELNYGSIGATFSPLRTQQPSRPQSVVFGAVTSPTPSMFSGYTDVREERTVLSIVEDIETNRTVTKTIAITTPIKKEVLAIAEEIEDESSETGSEDSALSQLAKRVKNLEGCGIKKNSGLREYLANNNGGSSLSADSNAAELFERVQWLEKVLGVGRGGANRAFENEIYDLKGKLDIVEQRLQEEMELKAMANKTIKSLQAKLGGLNEERELVDKCLRNEVSSLKSQLAFEKIKSETAESDVKAALGSVLDLGLACEKKDAEIAELTRANQQSLKRQAQLQSDLVACAQGNDALRARVLALASDGSTKEHTLISALAQLKSLSENMYSTQKQLEEEKKRRHGEVEALQFSLDDVSRQMLNMGKKMHTLESDNESLRMELKRLRAEKEQTQRMRRSARGF
jgi:hypothetical protein